MELKLTCFKKFFSVRIIIIIIIPTTTSTITRLVILINIKTIKKQKAENRIN